MRILFFSLALLIGVTAFAQNKTSYWQQRVEYMMEIDMDVDNHRYKGKQEIKYINNSPDTLYRVFYHLYFNAFQPGSMMDVKSRTIVDPDPRIGDKIFQLSEDEIGYQKILEITQNGIKCDFEVYETVMKLSLVKPALPNSTIEIVLKFKAQVPLQVRRTGRNNQENIKSHLMVVDIQAEFTIID